MARWVLVSLLFAASAWAQKAHSSKFDETVSLSLTATDIYREVLASRINAKLREIADISIVHSDADIELDIVAVAVPQSRIMAVSFVATEKSHASDFLSALSPQCVAISKASKDKTVASVMSRLDNTKTVLKQMVMVHGLDDAEGLATRIVAAFDTLVLEPWRASRDNPTQNMLLDAAR